MAATHATRLFVTTLALACACATWATTPAKAPLADLDAFVKTLPAPGAPDHVFLAAPAPLLAKLAIDPAVVRGIDPGVVCDPAAAVPSSFQAALGHAGRMMTTCTPDGLSQGFLTLADGSTWITRCGEPVGVRVKAWADVTVGEHKLHASTGSPSAAAARVPSRTCTGWRKLPG